MKQHQTTFTLRTQHKALYEITRQVGEWLESTGAQNGVLTLFCRHTSAGLLICENAASAVQRDLLMWLENAVPEGMPYEHDDEGPDDMPAHIRSVLTGASLSIPVGAGRMVLGTWQGIFLAEHRSSPHHREVVAHYVGV